MENNISLFLLIPALLAAIAVLVWSADHFVEGAAAIADNMGLSPLIIGLTVISIGTSAPEILVSASAAMNLSSGLAVGNALGSNLANTGLVIGITALICPLAVRPSIVRSEIPIMIGATLLAGMILMDGHLGRGESLILVVALLAFIGYLIWAAKNGSSRVGEETEMDIPHMPMQKAILITIIGLLVLIASSRALVWSASELASQFGVSDLVIGITIVAVGTSLPELAASLASALKGHSEMAIGNVVGSNIFNLLAVLPVAGIIYPTDIEGVDFIRDFGTVLTITLILSIACLWRTRGNKTGYIGRPTAVVLLVIYAGYYGWLLI